VVVNKLLKRSKERGHPAMTSGLVRHSQCRWLHAPLAAKAVSLRVRPWIHVYSLTLTFLQSARINVPEASSG
jgi:hypothetical protein